MFQNLLRIPELGLPAKRPFQWRVFTILVVLYFLGNLAGIPLLLKTNAAIEPIWFWAVATLVSAIVIGSGLVMANHTGLGAPWLEGKLSKDEWLNWMRSGFALTIFILIAGLPFSLIVNRNANPATYPFGWELLPASYKAGSVEEIGFRLFLVSLFVWVGKFIRHEADGRPSRSVYWAAILIVGLLFGWAHVDSRLGLPMATFWDYGLIMFINSGLGIYFGWLFWKLGLEWAIFTHFVYDAFVSMCLVPVYLQRSFIAWVILVMGLVLALLLSWGLLRRNKQKNEPRFTE
jgi:hypothetical protein